jgi:hypothetical protein
MVVWAVMMARHAKESGCYIVYVDYESMRFEADEGEKE